AQYFGKNKVRYETFDWKVLKTEHFDIYYYEREREAAVEAGRMAERWYARLSQVLAHNLPLEQPIVLYASHPAFRQTTVTPGFIGATTGGFTEALKRRVVLPFAGPLAETDHVLGHELVHAFQYDISKQDDLPGVGFQAPGAVRLPLWFVEGMAEYLSVGPVDALTAMWLRDAVKRDELPTIDDLYDPKYFPYRWGHAFWAYVAGRYGDQVVAEMLKSAGRAGSPEGAINRVLKTTPAALTEDWHRSIMDEYEPRLRDALGAAEQAKQLIDSEEAGELNVSPALSPDGKHVIFFSEKALFSINIYLANTETGEIIRKITDAAIDPHLESLEFVKSAGAWAADGQRFVFGSINQGQPRLSIYDMEQETVTQNLSFPQLGEIFNPTWSPDGRHIAFSAIEGGLIDLYIYDLEKENLRQVTNDMFSELQPSWSPDGRRIAFVTDRFTSDLPDLTFGDYRLALLDPASGQIEQVQAFDRGKHINPQWSPDSGSLYFISDQNGTPNIYRLDVGGRQLSQVTDLQTGASGISKLSPAISSATKTGKVVFSVFNEGNYKIFSIDSNTTLAGRTPVDSPEERPAVLPPRAAPSGEVFAMLQKPQAGLRPSTGFNTTEYKANLDLDYIAPPNISMGSSNFGTFIGGGTGLYFSDILGQHNLMTAFQTVGSTGNILNNTSAIVSYQNLKNRWTWGGIGGQVPYVTGGYRRFLAEVDGETAVVEQDVRFWQINREIAGTIAYPFSQAQRLEFAGGYRNLSFDTKTRTRAFS
ncbi:MAG: peptidase S9, partial [Bryobacteraceae bacterium]